MHNNKIEQPWHRFVFDVKNRKFVGKFNAMYKLEKKKIFDIWNQLKIDDEKKFSTLFIKKKNFKRIVNFGCGKGILAKQIKDKNNFVTAIDLSSEAIKLAKKNNKKKVKFLVIKKNQSIKNFLKIKKKIDLVICVEVLSYIKEWKKYIIKFSKIADNLYVALSLPYRPIGYVKSFVQLEKELSRHYKIECKRTTKSKIKIYYCINKSKILKSKKFKF
tara:strand:- start:15 stop:665 length:651 start_codon:yes stop_codon:yes gene_type:complete